MRALLIGYGIDSRLSGILPTTAVVPMRQRWLPPHQVNSSFWLAGGFLSIGRFTLQEPLSPGQTGVLGHPRALSSKVRGSGFPLPPWLRNPRIMGLILRQLQ